MYVLKYPSVVSYLKNLTFAALILSFFFIPDLVIAGQDTACSEPPHRILIVRHAEKDRKERNKEVDKQVPLKNPCGFQMAKELAEELKNENLSAIYTTEYTRTKQTAKPIADSIPLSPTVIDKNNLTGFVESVCTKSSDKTILVVGHSDTSENFLKILGLEPRRIDYCELFIINYINGSPVFSRIRYCNYNELCGS